MTELINEKENRMEKDFLTIDEARSRGLPYCKYAEGVYEYKVNGGWTLIQDGNILVSGADYVEWYKKDTYSYQMRVEPVNVVNGKREK